MLVDLDNCHDLETGRLVEWAEDAVEVLHPYAEVSPERRGRPRARPRHTSRRPPTVERRHLRQIRALRPRPVPDRHRPTHRVDSDDDREPRARAPRPAPDDVPAAGARPSPSGHDGTRRRRPRRSTTRSSSSELGSRATAPSSRACTTTAIQLATQARAKLTSRSAHRPVPPCLNHRAWTRSRASALTNPCLSNRALALGLTGTGVCVTGTMRRA